MARTLTRRVSERAAVVSSSRQEQLDRALEKDQDSLDERVAHFFGLSGREHTVMAALVAAAVARD